MTIRNRGGLSSGDGSIGGRGDSGAFVTKAAGFFLVVAALCLYGEPAHAAIWDPVLDFLDETTLAFEQVVGGFILLLGLVAAWVVAIKTQSPANGFTVAICVIAFAAMVANNENLAAELGFGGG